jgi:hypothetical protein
MSKGKTGVGTVAHGSGAEVLRRWLTVRYPDVRWEEEAAVSEVRAMSARTEVRRRGVGAMAGCQRCGGGI